VNRRRVLSRSGIALLEVIVAVAVVGISATSVLALTIEVAVSARRSFEAEARWRKRERLIETMTRSTALQLRAQVGRRNVAGEWLAVSQLASRLYRVEIVAADGTVLLGTVVFADTEESDVR
jgi:hypothetical protein